MLLFRSEEHVQNWCAKNKREIGGLLSLTQVWGIAQAWYSEDRRDPNWKRKSKDEAQMLFTSLGLTSSFWQL